MKDFKEALEYLGNPDYSERIFNSSSTSELRHLADYIELAEKMKAGKISNTSKEPPSVWFREWFVQVVDWAQGWGRPESVYQHISRIFYGTAGGTH